MGSAPGLGVPRLGNPLGGTLSPLSLLFYAVPAPRAFAYYPALALGLLALFGFALFRSRGLGPGAALFGALSFATMGNVATHIQHPPYLETLVWLPATLWAWERYRQSGHGGFAALGGIGFAFQCLSGGPQYLLYNALVMALWIGRDLWAMRGERTRQVRAGAAAAGLVLSGALLASWLLLPASELAAHSQRTLLASPEAFRDSYRAAPSEVLLALAAELFWIIEAPPLRHGAPHTNMVNLSLLVPGLALLTLRRPPHHGPEWIGAGFFLLGMLGSAGGVTTLLAQVFPPAAQLRAPIRMVVPAGFLLSWLAACGLARASGSRPWLAGVALAWLVVVGWTLKRPADEWVDPAAFQVPEAIRTAQPRIAVDPIRSKQPPPRFAYNAGIAAGLPTLLPNDALRPRNYFEALFASQFGSLHQTRKLDTLIGAPVLPLVRPALPLMRAFGLHTVIRYDARKPRAVAQPDALGRFFLASRVLVAQTPEQRWALAASRDWDPRVHAIVSDPEDAQGLSPPGGPRRSGAVLRVFRDEPDVQSLEIDSDGGVLVTSALMYPGWHVSIDGAPARPLEVDLALRGVVVPPGTHRVVWRYRPPWLGTACVASLGGIALLLALCRLRADPSRPGATAETA